MLPRSRINLTFVQSQRRKGRKIKKWGGSLIVINNTETFVPLTRLYFTYQFITLTVMILNMALIHCIDRVAFPRPEDHRRFEAQSHHHYYDILQSLSLGSLEACIPCRLASDCSCLLLEALSDTRSWLLGAFCLHPDSQSSAIPLSLTKHSTNLEIPVKNSDITGNYHVASSPMYKSFDVFKNGKREQNRRELTSPGDVTLASTHMARPASSPASVWLHLISAVSSFLLSESFLTFVTSLRNLPSPAQCLLFPLLSSYGDIVDLNACFGAKFYEVHNNVVVFCLLSFS